MDAYTTLKSVEADLRGLSVESRKKYPNVKEAAERAILRLRPLHEHATDADCIQALNSDYILRPFLVACSTKEPHLTVLALAAIQKLFSVNCVTPSSFSTIIGTLRVQAESQDDSVQLKILQTLLLATSPKSFQDHEDSLRQALGICFRLHDVKNPIIHNTAAAALRQVISLLFDRASVHCTSNGVSDAKLDDQDDVPPLEPSDLPQLEARSPIVKDDLDDSSVPLRRSAYMLFLDLCMLSRGEGGRWLNINSKVPTTLGIEIMESILCNSENQKLFLTITAFSNLLKEQVCPLVVKLLRSTVDFPLMLRLIRCVITLARFYHTVLITECEIFLSLLIRMLEPEFSQWSRILALEALKTLCADPSLLYFFFTRYDMDTDVAVIFGSMAHALGKYVHQTAMTSDTTGAHQLWEFAHKSKGLDLLNEMEPPEYDDLYPVSLSVQAVINIVHGLAELEHQLHPNHTDDVQVPQPTSTASDYVFEDFVEDNDTKQQPTTTSTSASSSTTTSSSSSTTVVTVAGELSPDAIKAMANVSWRPILAALRILLSKSDDEDQIQHLLMAYQSFTNTCGKLNLKQPRDEFLSTMCKFALPTRSNRSPNKSPDKHDGSWELTAKNIQAMKALFNIAHCLGSILGSAWLTVLETFEELDRIMQINKAKLRAQQLKPKPRSKRTSISGLPLGDGDQTEELDILAAALSRLFESSRYLDDGAITDLLSALGTLSLSSLANAAAKDQTYFHFLDLPTKKKAPEQNPPTGTQTKSVRSRMRMFALVNLMMTIEHNMFRIEKLWDVAISHLNCVINHKNVNIRRYGMECLTRLSIQALGPRPSPPKNAEHAAPMSKTPTKPPTNDEFQQRVLRPLFELYRSKYEDTRENILSAVIEILEETGQVLNSGWPTLLNLLKEVAKEQPVPAFIHFGFKSIQLIANDFLDSLPCNCFQSFIEGIGLYGVQQYDPNISFTSIGLLWGVSDHLITTIKTLSNSEPPSSHQEQEEIEHDARTVVSEHQRVLTAALCDSLQISVFSQLQKLCSDLRPEVRNSAVQTIHSAIVAHGPQMSRDSWLECLKSIIIPLIKDVFENALQGSAGHVGHDVQLGKEKNTGKAVMMMIHHSRNTAEKQWDETRVYVLQGSSRVFRLFFPVLCSLPGFDEYWTTYLSVIENSIVCYNSEVAVAAISAIQDVVVAPDSISVLEQNRSLWEAVLTIYDTAVQASVQEVESVDFQFDSYRHLLESFLVLSQNGSRSRKLFIESDIALLLRLSDLLTDVTLAPAGKEEQRRRNAAGISDKRETPLQKATLQILEKLTPVSDTLWPLVLKQVVRYIKRAGGPMDISESKKQEFDVESIATCEFVHKSISLIQSLYCDDAPEEIRGALFEEVVESLSQVMNARRLPDHLRTAAVTTFIKVMSVGLPALNNVGCSEGEALRIWALVADTLSQFIHPRSPTTYSHNNSQSSSSSMSPSSRRRAASSPTSMSTSLVSSLQQRIQATVATVIGTGSVDPEQPQQTINQNIEVNLQIEVVKSIVENILPQSHLARSSIQRRIISLLSVRNQSNNIDGDEIASDSGLLAHACLEGLFDLCAASASCPDQDTDSITMIIACMAFPMLMSRCGEVLRWYLTDERQSGQCPLPQSRREEVAFILEQLPKLEIHPRATNSDNNTQIELSQSCLSPKRSKGSNGSSTDSGCASGQSFGSNAPMSPGMVAIPEPVSSGNYPFYGVTTRKAHLLRLFPILCECISIRERSLCDLLKVVFHAASKELGLE